jgi:hypothetical protein
LSLNANTCCKRRELQISEMMRMFALFALLLAAADVVRGAEAGDQAGALPWTYGKGACTATV